MYTCGEYKDILTLHVINTNVSLSLYPLCLYVRRVCTCMRRTHWNTLEYACAAQSCPHNEEGGETGRGKGIRVGGSYPGAEDERLVVVAHDHGGV